MQDGFPQLYRKQLSFRSDPQVVAKGDLLSFWLVLGRGHSEKFRTRVKNEKTQFPGARGPKIEEKNVTALSGIVVCNFFPFCVLTDRTTPRGGKSQNTGLLGTFGLGQPLGTWRNSGGTKKSINSLIETEKR